MVLSSGLGTNESEAADIVVRGSLNASRRLTGMAEMYSILHLEPGDELDFEKKSDNEIKILRIKKAPVESNAIAAIVDLAGDNSTGSTGALEYLNKSRDDGDRNGVFPRKKLKYIHIDLFRPENLNFWTLQTEPDVYMVFGVLQEYTAYRYCCGTSANLLKNLGYFFGCNDDGSRLAKPDAILIDVGTKEYLIAEFKMNSSDFVSNHHKDDIDVLIVWDDDSKDKINLPNKVVCLKDVAREMASESITT